MDRAGNEFLTTAGFSSDQNRLSVTRHPVYQLHKPVHGGTRKNELRVVNSSAFNTWSDRYFGLSGAVLLRCGRDHRN